ncbi:MAG: membrane dipeptidase [Oscillospiraceae bacterium]|nr:membrane dipeptidase [Oscillospiraceae bacterium]
MYSYKIFDAHCDTLCMIADHGGDIKCNSYNIDKERMSRYISYIQIFACFIAPEYSNNAMERFIQLADVFDKQDFSGITPILSIEGGDMLQSLEDIDYIKSRGVRCITLTWNHSNKIAGGADEPEQGLTQFGRDVVRRLNECGIIIDMSHINDKSFYDIEKINTGVLIASHSNSRAICNHRRNLTDDMFKIIRDTGGVVGLNLYPEFLTENKTCNISDAVRHVNHWLELDGGNTIGLGSDFDGVGDKLPIGIRGCQDYYKVLDVLDKGIIEKISHENFERVFS